VRRSLSRLPALAVVAAFAVACVSAPATRESVPSAAVAVAAAAAGPTVIVVRHAERAAEPAADPGLTAAGEARAESLAALLGGARVTGIVTTQFRRTQLTAAPLAARRGVTPVVVPAAAPVAQHAAAVAAAARAAGAVGDTVVVVGHSNTVAAIVRALGGSAMPDLCDRQYATLFAVTPLADGTARVARSSYGASDPADAASCAPANAAPSMTPATPPSRPPAGA
jgi:phosphohistidine phosphatase SixA